MTVYAQTSVSLFQVDLPTFMTLTEEDLKELGISAFGARKKMLLTIQGESSVLDIPLVIFLPGGI